MEAVAEGVRVWGARGRPATPTYKISAMIHKYSIIF